MGSLGTAKAFTGQEADPLTGLYYYHARWYDPVVGMFVSVDTQEGNAQGVNPYGYVRENPETMTDPTGEYRCGDPNNCNPSPPPTGGSGGTNPPSNPCVLSGGNPQYCAPKGGGGKPSPGTGSDNSSGCAGNGGKNGTSARSCTTQSPPQKTCKQACRVELAQEYASSLSHYLSKLAWLLAILGGLISLVGGIIQAIAVADDATIFGIPAGLLLHGIGFAMVGFGAMIALIGAEAGFLSNEFSIQSGWGADRWTIANLEAFRQQEIGYANFAGTVFTLISIALDRAQSLVGGNASFLALGAKIGGLIGIVSQAGFKSSINFTIDEEEGILNPNTYVDCTTVSACN